jgi:DNA primase
MRLVRLNSTFHEKSEPFFLSPDDLNGSARFKTLCLSKGDYLWKGSDTDLHALIEQIILDGDSVPMKLMDSIGNDEENKQWVFGNMILKYDGKILRPKTLSKTIYQREFTEESVGWRINPLGSSVIPELSETYINPDEILTAFHDAWGNEGVLGLSYMMASLFSTDIFNEYQMFPFCLIYGEKESGKTTMSDAMMFTLGFPPNQTSMNIAETTAVAINRKMNYYRSLPCRFDEYRTGEKKIDDKKSILRSIYNRQGATKGLRTPWGVREVEPKGTFILIGEQKPDDPALVSRCIPLYLTRFSRSNKSYEATRWLYSKNKALSYLTFHVLKDYVKYRDAIMVDIAMTNKSLSEQNAGTMDMRTQTHYAILMSVMGNVFGEEVAGVHIARIHTALLSTMKKFENESMLNRFFNEVNTMRVMGEPVHKYIAIEFDDRSKGVMYFSGLFQEWKRWKQQRGGGSMFDESTLREYLTSQPFYEKGGELRVMKDLDSKAVSCVRLNIEHKSLPMPVKDLYKELKSYAYAENNTQPISFGNIER